MALLDLLGRRWTLRVIWELSQETAPTFRELQVRCDGVSSSVLTARLGELSEAGIVAHDGHGYALTAQGRDLLARLSSLEEWASLWRPGAAGSTRG
jgi:DNA-binding HxlR family transcriptional regulator